jgi:hypothetical protein
MTQGIKEQRLFFIDTELFDNGSAIRGGVIITDGETKPYEFRCTSPIRPTALQRVLYGDTLDEHIHIELVGIPLLKAAKEEPSLVIVRKPVLLNVRPKVSVPVVLAASRGVGSSGGDKQARLVAHAEFPAEADSAQAMLAKLIEKRDLMEPFERLRVALTEAHKQRIGETTT